MGGDNGGSTGWRVVTWLLRLIGIASLAMAGVSFEHDLFNALGLFGAVAIISAVLQYVTNRWAQGWIFDSRGERQKVEQWSRGGAVYHPTSRMQRLIEEAQLKSSRRKKLVWFGLFGFPLAYLTNWTYGQSFPVELPFPVFLVFSVFCLGRFAYEFFLELLYLTGYQDMKGAKVLDPAPQSPGLADVAAQKAHGDARIASGQEAVLILNSEKLNSDK